MRVTFGTVLHRGSVDYFSDFLGSLASQTLKNFDLLIIAEGISKSERLALLEGFDIEHAVIDVPPGNPIHRNRIILFESALLQKTELLVLGDSDDTFAETRVEETVLQFDSDYAFFYNKIIGFEGQNVFPPFPVFATEGCIDNFNFLGLSNTSLNLGLFDKKFFDSLKDGNTLAFDWYLYSRILGEVGEGKLVKNAGTKYRIHGDNVAGLANTTDLEKELAVKIRHYGLLALHDARYARYYDACVALARNLENGADGVVLEEPTFWWSRINIYDGTNT